MPSDALFLALANAEAQPSRTFRAVNAATDALKAPVEGYLQTKGALMGLATQKAALLDHYTKLADTVGPDRAMQIIGPALKQAGVDLSGAGPSTETNYTPDQLTKMGTFGKNRIEAQKAAQGMDIAGPRTVPALKSSILSSGQMSPDEFDIWAKQNVDPTGMIPNKNFDDLTKSLGLKAQASRGGFYGQKGGQITLSQLPSQMPQSSNAGAAAMVQMSARQGMSLIADPLTDPKRIGLAAGDMARTVLRAAPTLDAMHGSNYADTLANKLNGFSNGLSSGQLKPNDIPAVRKQMYDTFKELRESAKPFIAQHLANVQDSLPELPPNWENIKRREMGDDIADIPFRDNADTWKTAKNAQGVTIRSKDNWATFEPVQAGAQ